MKDGLKLKNGKEIYANCGIIGLSLKPEDDEVWYPSEGYDGGFPRATYDPYFDKEDMEYINQKNLENRKYSSENEDEDGKNIP
mgnify:CR=1 FL=1